MIICTYESEKILVEVLKNQKYTVHKFVKFDGVLKTQWVYIAKDIDEALEMFHLLINENSIEESND